MLTPTTLTQGSPTPSVRRSSSAGPVASQPQIATPANGRSNDQLNLSQTSQARNPYQGTAPGFSAVKVDSWGKGDNDSVVQILLNQGFTQQEIYGKSSNGKTLLEEVTRVNGLRNANLIRAGQDLVVPSKQAPAAPVDQPGQPTPETPSDQTERPAPESPADRNEQPIPEAPVNQTTPPTEPERANDPKVNQVRVDRWGKGPNSSLGAILKSQGFEDRQIFAEDANGDSLLKKVARANGLESPDRIFAGSSLKVPNSMEALAQMSIPEMPVKAEPTSPPVRVEPPTRTETPDRTETPRQPDNGSSEPTANMGMLLDGVKSGDFTRQEFQYLNARSSRYVQMRARYSGDGYSNDELTSLGQMERRYGVEFARLSASDDVALPEFPKNSSNPDLAIQVKHYHESGPMYDSYSNGTMNSETAIQRMIKQRDEARRQEAQ